MAPSRALIFSHRSVHLNFRSSPSARMLSTSCRIRGTTAQLHRLRLPTLHPGPSRHFPASAFASRLYSSTPPEPPDYLNERELYIFNKVKAELEPVKLEVQDISGGCGSMYALQIESPKFKGLTVIKQHKMVNEVLKEEIKGWHGVQLRTKAA